MKTNLLSYYLTVVCSVIFSLSSSLAQRPGIECGCTKYGDYVEPASKGILVEQGASVQEGSSSKGKYTVEVVDGIAPNTVNITIFSRGVLIYNQSNHATGWGFSPDEDKFVMHGLDQFGKHWCTLLNLNPDDSREGEWAAEFSVLPPTNMSSASIRFSPHGKYLLYAGVIVGSGDLLLKVFDAKNGTLAYDGSTSALIGSPSGKGTGGWGFSSDTKNATFVHAYQTDVDKYTLAVKNLKTPPGEYILFSTGNLGEARWYFSKCGDYFAWFYDNPLSDPSLRLYRTDSENTYESASAITWWKMVSNADGHYIKYQNADSLKVVGNTADETCPDVTKPKWENAILDTGLVEGTTMELHWDGDTDNIGVVACKIFRDDEEIKEIEGGNRYTVTGLEPQTAYTFRIEAGDEAGNWSTTGPEKTFSTLEDNAPSWPDPVIKSKDITETKITLMWKAATDDYRVTFYRIMVDGEEVRKVGGDTLRYRVTGLMADSTYTFTIMAGDAAGQWTSSSGLVQKMPPAVPPYWPVGAALTAEDITETSMILIWPAAEDYYNQVKGFRISMNGEVLNPLCKLTDYAVKDLEEGSAYEFEVVAIDESGGESDPLTATLSTLSAYVVTPLISDPADQKRPDINGNLVVWWDERNDGGDIYSYDLETDSMRRITTDPAIQFNPAVSGERIVWTDTRNGNMDIYMYDPLLGERAICTASGDQDLAAIDGDIIVWRDGRSGNWDIYMYDLAAMQESPVITTANIQNWPDVSAKFVVYADNRSGNWNIYLYDIVGNKEINVCTNSYDQTFPVITGGPFIFNLTIAYMDERSGKNIYVHYPYYFGDQGFEYLVPLDKTPFISPQLYPHLEDDQLVYQDLLGGAGTAYNIYAYQFINDFFGERKEISVDPVSSPDQTRPRTSNGNIVWQYEKDGNADIYMWKRPPGSDLQLSVKENKDPLMPGDTLRYWLTLHNDGPNRCMLVKTEVTLPQLAKFVAAFSGKGRVVKEGINLTWEIDTFRSDGSDTLEIVFATYDIALLELRAATSGGIFDQDPSNNTIYEITKVKNTVARFVDHGSNPSMVTEPDGRVHLVYVSEGSLMYATRPNKGQWVYRRLDDCPSCMESNMILDLEGNLQMVVSSYNYEIFPRGRLYHGTLAGDGSWSKRIIAVSDTGFYGMSVKADSDNELHLVFLQAMGKAAGGSLKEMRTMAGVWTLPEIFSTGWDDVDMTLDHENNMHVSYYSPGLGIVYQKKGAGLGGLWSVPVGVEPGWKGAQLEAMSTSIVVDRLNNPHISYVGQVNNDSRENTKYAWWADGRWNIRMVDKGHFQSSGNRIIVDDPEGNANFGYVNFPTGEWGIRDLKYATNMAGPWIRQILDENCGVTEIAMGRDSYKNTHFSFSTAETGEVKYIFLPPLDYFMVTPDTLDFGSVEQGTTKTMTMTLTNPTSNDISIDAILINDTRFTLSKSSFMLNKWESDSVKVTFNQSGSSGVDSVFAIWYNKPADLYMDIPVRVKGWTPELTVDQDPILFGAVAKGTLITQTITLTNTGATDLIISNIEVKYEPWPGYVYPTDFSLIGHNCSIVPPGGSCEVEVGFKPLKDETQLSYLIITSNDAENPVRKISITGSTAVAQIYPVRDRIDFGYCQSGQSISDSLILVNTGDVVLNITSVSLSGTDQDQFSFTNTCTSVDPKDSCMIYVSMEPTRTGDFQATLSITSNSQYYNLLNIILAGSSYLRTLEVSDELINFANINVGEQATALLELNNTGTTNVTVSIIELTGADSYEFMHSHACYIIPAGGSCTDTLRFVPLFEGSKTALLRIISNDSDEPEKTVTLTGQAGTLLPLQLSISAEPETGIVPLNVSFHSLVTGGQPPYNYLWDFRDGSNNGDPSTEHTFLTTGTFWVTCVVTDVNLQTITDSVKIAAGSESIPVVMASAEPSSGYAPLMVQFEAVVSGGDAPLSISWDFDDGSLSQLQNPVHGFSFTGQYNVKVTVTDADDDSAIDSVMVTVLEEISISGEIMNQEGDGYVENSTVILVPETWPLGSDTLHLSDDHTFQFADIDTGNYAIYVIPDPVLYPDYLPTYLGNFLLLSDVEWLDVDGVVSGLVIDVIRKPDTQGGTGAINGTFILGESGKKIAVAVHPALKAGSGVQDCYVYLKDALMGDWVAWDVTDMDGGFGFDSLQNGTFIFQADYLGLPMDPDNAMLELSPELDSLEILAIAGITEISIELAETGTGQIGYDEGIRIYPVPATHRLIIELAEGALQGGFARISIFNLNGNQLIVEYPFITPEKSLELDISGLADGFYLLRIEDQWRSYEIRFIKAD